MSGYTENVIGILESIKENIERVIFVIEDNEEKIKAQGRSEVIAEIRQELRHRAVLNWSEINAILDKLSK